MKGLFAAGIFLTVVTSWPVSYEATKASTKTDDNQIVYKKCVRDINTGWWKCKFGREVA
tara:strand:+ start:778 stop:954 length:177 start_codon:yes stop_codon:yes gene_type:complete